MPLNKDCVGRTYPAITTAVTLDAIQKYARAYNDDNHAFFDASRAGGIVAPPMFGVVVIWEAVMKAVMDPDVRADLLRLVHGEQDMEFLAPIRPGDEIAASAKIISIETKATGETMTVELNAANQKNQPVQKTLFSVFIRGGRNREAGASEARVVEPERGAPLFTVAQTIDADQTYRYAEASGDRNPIHVDENVAKMAGLPGIIVHGLCTMAFTSKVAIDKLCAGDPARLRRLRVRFSRPVRPGQTITTMVWRAGDAGDRKVFAFETHNAEGQAVIKGGIAEVSDAPH
ncbi:MAG TPA: MaoC/PaaZ C-terminal domain-containing protein [Candidatus Acidoferrales bacterium]|nr:MaoC/PaaZ C-terminal domain-containing protein [Candidatus Acidoferrales bacterium]